MSTFGLLKHLTQSDVVALIDILAAADYLQQVELERFRPVIELTPEGSEVMSGRQELDNRFSLPEPLRWKIRGAVGNASVDEEEQHEEEGESAPVDLDLLETLKQWRRQQGAESGRPLYQILSNDTLVQLATLRPNSLEKLLEIKGIGPAKLSQYGESLLAMLSEDDQPQPELPPKQLIEQLIEQPGETPRATETPREIPPPRAQPNESPTPGDDGQVRPSHYWTWRLLAAGFSPQECAAVRGLQREVVIDHAIRAVDAGWQVQSKWCLSEQLLEALEAVIGPGTPEQIRPLLADLPEGTRYEEVQLYLKCRGQGLHPD